MYSKKYFVDAKVQGAGALASAAGGWRTFRSFSTGGTQVSGMSFTWRGIGRALTFLQQRRTLPFHLPRVASIELVVTAQFLKSGALSIPPSLFLLGPL